MFDITYIYKNIKKNLTRIDILIILCLLALYFVTRLIRLDSFPIFSDEGIYIHWAKVAWHDANWRFISLTDGRQPLQTWMTIPFLKLFSNNLLFGGRLFGILSGFVGLMGIFVTARYIFNKRIAYIASLLFIITPYLLFTDRLAMIDSFVAASSIWIFFFSVILIQTLRLDVSLIFGLFSGIALLAKSSVSMFMGLSLTSIILLFQKKNRFNIINIINFIILYLVVFILAIVIYNIQRLSPFFHFVDGKNNTFILTIHEFLQNPFQVFFYNVVNIPYYTAQNLGFASFIFGIIGLSLYTIKNKLMGLYFIIWIIAPYIAISFFNKVLFSRYLIFLLIPFILFTAYLIDYAWKRYKNKFAIIIVLTVSYLFALYFNYTIIFDQKNIPLVPTDRGQYLEAWPAGWGAKEIVQYARDRSNAKPVVLLAEGTFGMSGDVLDTFLMPQNNISIRGFWPLGLKELTDAQKDLDTDTILVVFSHTSEFPPGWPIKLIKKYDKPGNQAAIYLFELTR